MLFQKFDRRSGISPSNISKSSFSDFAFRYPRATLNQTVDVHTLANFELVIIEAQKIHEYVLLLRLKLQLSPLLTI